MNKVFGRLADDMIAITFACVLTLYLLGQLGLWVLPDTPLQAASLRSIILLFCTSTIVAGGVIITLGSVVALMLTPTKRDETLLQMGGFLIVLSILGYWSFSQFPFMAASMCVMGGVGATSLGLGIGLTARTVKKPVQ